MMNDQDISTDKLSLKVNALLIIDIQEKIIRPIFDKDLIIKNIKKLINAYQILEENIFVSEQNPLKLGVTIPELTPIAGFRKFEKMEFSLAKLEEFSKELKDKKILSKFRSPLFKALVWVLQYCVQGLHHLLFHEGTIYFIGW